MGGTVARTRDLGEGRKGPGPSGCCAWRGIWDDATITQPSPGLLRNPPSPALQERENIDHHASSGLLELYCPEPWPFLNSGFSLNPGLS